MGAQQAKSDDDSQNCQIRKQHYRSLQCPAIDVATHAAKAEIMNEIHTETVMSEQIPSIVSPTKLIKVANFAKIKKEPRAEDECIENLNFTEENKEESNSSKESIAGQQDATVQNKDTNAETLKSYGANTIEPPLTTSIPNCSHILNAACSNLRLIQELLETLPTDILNFSEVSNIASSNPNISENSSNRQVKQELLETQSNEVESTYVSLQIPEKEATVDIDLIKNESSEDPLNNDYATKEFIIQPTAEVKLERVNIENSFEIPVHIIRNTTENCNFINEVIEIDEDCVKNEIFGEDYTKNEEDIKKEQQSHHSQLVRNPLAFSRNLNSKKKSRKRPKFHEKNKKDDIVNKTIKTGLAENNKDSKLSNTPAKIKIVDLEAEQSSINLKNLTIKSETLTASNPEQDLYNNSNLNKNCLSYNFNSSLDVNLSNDDNHESIEEIISNISLNTSQEYYSIIEMSSVENDFTPINKFQKKTRLKKCNIRRPYKSRQKRNLTNNNQGKIIKQTKRVRKPKLGNKKSRKYTERDFAFTTKCSKRNLLKKLPKTCIKTRRKLNKISTPKKIITNKKEDFPKPLKSEASQKDLNIATELPKPIMLKTEPVTINCRDKQQYLKAEYQPFVRLKRLKSEELLVPFKSKSNRRTRLSKSSGSNVAKRFNCIEISNEHRRDFLIQHAFSLNQRLKLNRLSIDHDHSYLNSEQHSLYSRLTTPFSLAMDTPNESLAETDSKYFSPQELDSLFRHSSTPDGSSMLSSHIDSGISTTATHDSNKTLLLEIAAERAFINNHLEYFGYSSIQFNLYNNLSDLNVFLKYLLGPVNLK